MRVPGCFELASRAILVVAPMIAPLTASAAEIDLSTEIVTAPATATPGQTASYEVSYRNSSASSSSNARVRLILPSGAFLDWTQQQRDAVAAAVSDTLGNSASVALDPVSCDNMLVNIVASGGAPPSLPAGASGRFSVGVPLPASTPTVGVFTVHSPPSVAGQYAFALGTCASCGDLDSCFGGPLSRITAVDADLQLVHASAGTDPTQGCGTLTGFSAGRIAVTRRGGCQFGTKALNAQNAGAAGVVIVNNLTGQNIHSLSLSPGDVGSQVTVPVILISYEDGEALIDALEAKARVAASLGGDRTRDLLFLSTAFHAPNTDTDAQGLNDGDAAVTAVSYPVTDPPEAAFTFSPSSPVKGQPVAFTDSSRNEPTSWSWQFGDGGTSSEQSPTHAYAGPGTYTVTLTASNGFGSDTATDTVTVAGLVPQGTIFFIPAASLAPGAAGSFFVTDVDVNNAGATTMIYQFVWLPRTHDNSSPLISSAFMLAANREARYPNVLAEVFGLSQGLGALGVISSSPDTLLFSRTYNQPQAKAAGTYGQGLPGIPAAAMTPTGVRQRILFMTENDDFRSNLGCQNGINTSLRVYAQLYRSDGTPLELKTIDIGPWSSDQLNRVFRDYRPIEAGFVEVWSTQPGAAFYCYGSVLDNQTSDPTTVLPQ